MSPKGKRMHEGIVAACIKAADLNGGQLTLAATIDDYTITYLGRNKPVYVVVRKNRVLAFKALYDHMNRP